MTTFTPTRRRAFMPMLFRPSPVFPLLPELEEITTRMNELMRPFGEELEMPAGWFPAMNVSETKEEFTVTAELPGMAAKDVAIEFAEGVLTVRGEKVEETKKEEKERKFFLRERRIGTFVRSVPFPGGINEGKIAAEFKDGVLTIHLPKLEETAAKKRTIPVTAP